MVDGSNYKTYIYLDFVERFKCKFFGITVPDAEGAGYLIDSDGRYAITLKSNVMTVHDGQRSFCKVVSMQYNQIEIQKHEIICGRIALKL